MSTAKSVASAQLRDLDFYRPVYSWHNFVTSNARFVGELLYAPEGITPTALLLLWAAVFIYAVFAPRSYASAHGLLDSNRSSADSIYSSDSQRWMSLPPAFRMVNDLCESFM